jgi:outer membrane autotransporter protein
MFAWDAKATATVAGLSDSLKDSGTDMFYGVGVRYNINRNLGVQLEWQKYDASDSDVTALGVALRYKF